MMMQTRIRRPLAAFIGACTGAYVLFALASDTAFAQRTSRGVTGTSGSSRAVVPAYRTAPRPGGRSGGSGVNVPTGVGIGLGILGTINKTAPTPPPRTAPPKRTSPPKQVKKRAAPPKQVKKRAAPPKQVKKTTVKKKQTVRRPPQIRRAPPVVLPDVPQFVANEVLVVMAPNEPGTAGNALAQAFNLTQVESNEISVLGALIVRFRYSDDRPLPQVIAALTADPRVESAQPNNWHLAAGDRKKQKSARQYALTKLDIGRAHKLAQGQGVPIAVIDTGVDKTHPTLAKSIDKSFDAIGDKKSKAQNHGTAIAGVIAGNGQVKGVAPKARLFTARAFYMHAKYKRPMTSSMILLKAIDWSHANGARVFNMSFTGPYDPLIKKALERVYDDGAILVAAAGNGGPKAPPAYPAAYGNVIAITAHDARDKLYPQANRGNYLAVAAPGVDVFVPKLKKAYGYSSGTSVAAAHVSGIIALLLEQHPGASPRDIVLAIKGSAHDLGAKGFDVEFGAGRADAYASLQSMMRNEKRLSGRQ